VQCNFRQVEINAGGNLYVAISIVGAVLYPWERNETDIQPTRRDLTLTDPRGLPWGIFSWGNIGGVCRGYLECPLTDCSPRRLVRTTVLSLQPADACLLCPTRRKGGNKRCFCPSFRPTVAYIANNSRTQRPRVPKFGRKFPHL